MRSAYRGGMGSDLPVRARAEITDKYARALREGVQGRTRGGSSDEICSVTGRRPGGRACAWRPQPDAHLVAGYRGPGARPAGTP